MGEVVLRAQGVRVQRGPSLLLQDIELWAEAGQVLAVLGPTGAGKTTLFRVLVGESRAHQGQVFLQKQNVTHLALWQRARRGLGYIPQTPSVLGDLTVRQNLQTFAALSGQRAQGVGFWAEQVSLQHRLELRAGALSGGERRRLELARALIGGPKVLICDEPFSGLDPKSAQQVATVLRQQAEQGVAVVLADHHVTVALGISHQAQLLLEGRMGLREPAESFLQHPLVRSAYLGGALGGAGQAGPGEKGA